MQWNNLEIDELKSILSMFSIIPSQKLQNIALKI